jgi:Arabinose-binding domain of AraC transcription regulator, N-term
MTSRLVLNAHERQARGRGAVALSSPTFGQALKNVVRYHRVLTEGIQLSFEFDQHHAVLAAVPADRSAMVGRRRSSSAPAFSSACVET